MEVALFISFKNFLPSVVVHTCNPSIGEAEAGESWDPGQSGLQSEFQACISSLVKTLFPKVEWDVFKMSVFVLFQLLRPMWEISTNFFLRKFLFLKKEKCF
jgi:hypothetical protein